MGSISNTTIEAELQKALDRFAQSNRSSQTVDKKGTEHIPGGINRNTLHWYPFPLVLESGHEGYVKDVDGHEYLDLCGEYSAGMFGHSHPVIKQAMHEAIDRGYSLGGINKMEGELASRFTSRFRSIEKLRFSSSGTETVALTLSLARAYSGKDKILVFRGGFHGGLTAFSKENGKTMNSPHQWVLSPYNDIPALQETVNLHKDEIGVILVELMQGGSGCIPGDVEFIRAIRRTADEIGAVLIFDEIMTGRMSSGGLQERYGIYPDLTTLGKFWGGGGAITCGVFGGKREIMDILLPGHPDGVYHSGTYNNNPISMAAGLAVMDIWQPNVAEDLFQIGEWLRNELNTLGKRTGSSLRVSGVGSLMNIHFTGKDVKTSADVLAGDLQLRELFFFDMLHKGYYMARRGMITLMTVHTKDQLQNFVLAVEDWIQERGHLSHKDL